MQVAGPSVGPRACLQGFNFFKVGAIEEFQMGGWSFSKGAPFGLGVPYKRHTQINS